MARRKQQEAAEAPEVEAADGGEVDDVDASEEANDDGAKPDSDDDAVREFSELTALEESAGPVPTGMLAVRTVDGRPLYRAGRSWGADEVLVREANLSAQQIEALEGEQLLVIRRGD